VLIYVILVSGFAAAYYGLTNFYLTQSAPLTWYGAINFSVNSFHGRSPIPSAVSLNDPSAAVAAAEALVGLFIEVIFIAAFSRRFLGD
jgi:hypothetical protein